jgi:thiamine biosynthesis protein ThiS
MRITVNGESRELANGLTVKALLVELDLAGARVAVERNRDLVPRTEFDACTLTEDDQLEIVTLVGGG